MSLAGQVALITGGSRGLGLAIAEALGAAGARVAVLAKGREELDRAAASLASRGIDVMARSTDVTDAASVDAAVAAVRERWGRLDALVLNAGTWQGAPIVNTTEAQWDLLLGLNLKGAFLTLRAALPLMQAAKRGTVVGISSIGGLTGQPGSAAYAASKWGLRGLLESAALELQPDGIRVSVVYPHNINSAGRALDSPEARRSNLDPADIAATVLHLVSAPAHVSFPHVDVWPIAAGIGVRG